MAQTVAQVIDNLVAQPLATAGPAPRPGELLNAGAQSFKPDEVRRAIELLPQFVAQARKEGKFEAMAGFPGQLVQVRLADSAFQKGAARIEMDPKPAQHRRQAPREFLH